MYALMRHNVFRLYRGIVGDIDRAVWCGYCVGMPGSESVHIAFKRPVGHHRTNAVLLERLRGPPGGTGRINRVRCAVGDAGISVPV